MELRVDGLTGASVVVAPSRQGRPDRPTEGCPFCVGGLEAPETYRVKAFPNRWPSLPDERCEIVLYTPDHDASFWSLEADHAVAVVDLWASRTAALGARDDVAYVLIGENRTASVGATIGHPHGQIYAYDHVPPVPRAELERARAAAGAAGVGAEAAGAGVAGAGVAEIAGAGVAGVGCALCDEAPGERLVASAGGWRAWVPAASAHPYGVVLAPTDHVADLPSLSTSGRRDLAAVLADVLERLDRLWPDDADGAGVGDRPAPMPSMLWIHQRPTDGGEWPDAHVHVEVAVPMRAPGVARYVACMELGSGIYVNPVAPEAAAAALRAVAVQR